MKKFLSLALALIMTLSLVTISAGATEYKDFTDKDEIQYEEAVAVLNKLGIITGYSEGDFRPEGELTRGAAAKIIVSLLIGPEAAEALPTTGNPYPDVPAGNVFAGYIGFCKTSGIISGYGDGTFRPNGTLTGYAFSKMLLGALGYKDQFEGLSGDGWTMNVANLGNAAGLFKRIEFKGGDTVNRETACLLALNTLKATMVEYTGGMNITTDAGSMVVNPTRTYVTSNQDYATHIDNRKASNVGNANSDQHYTVEFGEEHFRDLRMDKDRNGADDFGRPSNVWSYKKVTIGTYPIEPDFTFTTQVEHNVSTVSNATKERALGLSGYDTETDLTGTDRQYVRDTFTTLYVNGVRQNGVFNSDDQAWKISDYTDNGTLVEVYVSDVDADFIEVVSVIKTQLMQVKRVGSDYVSLELYDGDPSDASGTERDDPEGNGIMDDALYGYNQDPIDKAVNDVEVGDACYNDLKDMKVGDIVAVIPQSSTGTGKYDVAKVYVPETATGSLDRVDTFGTVAKGPNATSVTVGGTEYKIALWNKDLYDIDGDSIKVTKKDVTIYLDEYGNAMLATDVGATTNYMVIGSYRQGLVNGQLITYANGWDINGSEVSLNVGAARTTEWFKINHPIGTLVRYRSNAVSNTAEWTLDKFGVFDINYADLNSDGSTYELKTSNTRIRLEDYYTGVVDNTNGNIVTDAAPADANVWTDSGIKFIYISTDSDGEIDSIEFKSGMQSATNTELSGGQNNPFAHPVAEACVTLKTSNTTINGDSAVKAVVIKSDSSDASVNNLLYIARYHGSATRDNNGKVIQGYEVAMMNDQGKLEEDVVIYAERDLSIGTFARYTKATHEEDRFEPFYELKAYSEVGRAASVLTASVDKFVTSGVSNITTGQNKNFVFLKDLSNANANITGTYTEDRYLYDGDGDAKNLVDMRGANFYDLTDWDIDSASDLYDAMYDDVATGKYRPIRVALIFNDKVSNDSFRRAYAVIVLSVGPETNIPTGEPSVEPQTGDVRFADSALSGTGDGKYGTVTGKVNIRADGQVTANIALTKPDWAYTANDAEAGADTSATATNNKERVRVTYQVLRKGTDGTWETWSTGNVILGCNQNNTTGITAAHLTGDANANVYSITGLDLSNVIDPAYARGTEVVVEITDVQWTFVKVEKFVNGQPAGLDAGGEKYCLSIDPTYNSLSFPVGVVGATSGSADYTVTGVQNLNQNTGTFTLGSGNKQLAGSTKPVAEQGRPIRIELNTTDAVVQYTVKLDNTLNVSIGGNQDANPPLSTWFSASDGLKTALSTGLYIKPNTKTVDAGKETMIEIGFQGGATSERFIVSLVDIPGVTGGPQVISDHESAQFLIVVNDNITITKDNIKITHVAAPKVVSYAVNPDNNWVALTFDMPIKLVEGTKGSWSIADFQDGANRIMEYQVGSDGKTAFFHWNNDGVQTYVPVPKFSIIGTTTVDGVSAEEPFKGADAAGNVWQIDTSDNKWTDDSATITRIDSANVTWPTSSAG